jgi:hypothetical protein
MLELHDVSATWSGVCPISWLEDQLTMSTYCICFSLSSLSKHRYGPHT